MGRHGGGSRSGGSRGSSSRSGGSGGSSSRSSRTPFRGCYNRSYYDRRGRYHSYYTNSKQFGTASGWSGGTIFALVFITIHMFIMIGGMASSFIHIGEKINGDKDRIFIADHAEALSDSEEAQIMELLYEVYEKSGMPVTVYTDDFAWREHYTSIEVYSEELYYNIGLAEDAMILLYTTNNSDEFYDYEYDFYCGDDTISCLSDASFEKLIDNFYKGMAGLNVHDAIDYSFRSIMDELAQTAIAPEIIPSLVIILVFYSIFYITILGSVLKNNAAYKYFKEHPEQLSFEPLTLLSSCPNCGAPNSEQKEVCAYCNSLLKLSDKHTRFVSPRSLHK